MRVFRIGWISGLVLGVLLAVGWPIGAFANMANPYQPGDPVGEPAGPLAHVTIEHETLVLDLRPLATGGDVPVTATYAVRNDGPAENLALLFVAVALDPRQHPDAGVWLDDQRVQADPQSGRPLPASWRAPKTTPGLDGTPAIPYLPANQVSDGETFILPLGTGRHQIRVRYDARASAVSTQESPVRYWQLGYSLAPARNWAGFGILDVQVLLPPGWSGASAPALARQGDTLSGSFHGIPADSLGLTVQAPVPPPPGWIDPRPLTFGAGVVLSVVIGFALGRWAALGRRPFGWTLLAVASWSILWSFATLLGLLAGPPSPAVPDAQRAWTYGYGSGWAFADSIIALAFLAFGCGVVLTGGISWIARRRAASSTDPNR